MKNRTSEIEAGVLYFNNPGNRPAGLTVQVLDPRSLQGGLDFFDCDPQRSGLKADPRLVGLTIRVDPKGLRKLSYS